MKRINGGSRMSLSCLLWFISVMMLPVIPISNDAFGAVPGSFMCPETIPLFGVPYNLFETQTASRGEFNATYATPGYSRS